MFSRIAFSGLAAMALMALSSCAGDPDTIYNQAFGFQCSHTDGQIADVACKNRPPGYRAEQVSRYCYATIGASNCFDRPDPDRKNQQLGSSGY